MKNVKYRKRIVLFVLVMILTWVNVVAAALLAAQTSEPIVDPVLERMIVIAGAALLVSL